jgi:hypothetical protein
MTQRMGRRGSGGGRTDQKSKRRPEERPCFLPVEPDQASSTPECPHYSGIIHEGIR